MVASKLVHAPLLVAVITPGEQHSNRNVESAVVLSDAGTQRAAAQDSALRPGL